MSTIKISQLVATSPAVAANLTGAAAFEVTDSTVHSVGATFAQIRTALLAGGTGYATNDPIVAGGMVTAPGFTLTGATFTPNLGIAGDFTQIRSPTGTTQILMGGTTNNSIIMQTTAGVIFGNPQAAAIGPGPVMTITAAAGAMKSIQFQTAGLPRWRVASNNDAESGSNAGSSFLLQAFDDTGALINTPLTITRAAGGAIAFFAGRPITAGPISASASAVGGQCFVATGINGIVGNVLYSNTPAFTIAATIRFTNSAGSMDWGLTGTAAGGVFTGSSVGAAVWGFAAAARTIELFTANAMRLQIGDTGVRLFTGVGFYGTVPATQQTVTGSRGGNAALASLLTALAATGLIIDSSGA